MELLVKWTQSLYSLFGCSTQANTGDVLGILSVLVLFAASFALFFVDDSNLIEKEKVSPAAEPSKEAAELPKSESSDDEKASKEVVPPKETVSWAQRLKKGLESSRKQVWGKLENAFSGGRLDDDSLEEIEEILYGADIGTSTVSELIEVLRDKCGKEGFGVSEFKSFLEEFLRGRMEPIQKGLDGSLGTFDSKVNDKTKVIMIVGVNGAGKTTTIGKLATKLKNQGAKVVVGACDTFRAAAVDQLQVWCDRAEVEMIRAKEGSAPSGVGYQALEKARQMSADYCILDTAGRLHTKGNLMDELKKSRDVLKKLDPEAPHQILLVLDAITGQNALRQAEEFHKSLGVSGLIFTKCDGSSKGGSAISIVQQLKVPIAFIGVGESVDDLNNFDLDDYLKALLNNG
mgnify:CR=1 FL=1